MNFRLKLKKILSWILVVIWMIIIFYFSNMNTTESNQKSLETIEHIIDATEQLDTSKQEVQQENNNLTVEEQYQQYQKQQYEQYQRQQLINVLNYPVRKLAHMFIYFVLALLILSAFKNEKKRKKIKDITLVICFLYAYTDELHQAFVVGRSGNIFDVFIDTIGSLIAIMIYTKYANTKKNG